MTKDVEADNRVLYPVFSALRSFSCRDRSQQVQNVRLRGDKLHLNGVSYSVKDLDTLPDPFQLEKLFTVTHNNITAFFRSHSKLSNHFKSSFGIDGQQYSSMEQYLMSQKALLCHNQSLHEKIMKEDDPKVIKALGRNVYEFKSSVWEQEVDKILEKGLMAKFSSSQDLLSYLKSTGETTIIEANPSDKLYGVGISLEGDDLWHKDRWRGQNKLGKMLMKVRNNL